MFRREITDLRAFKDKAEREHQWLEWSETHLPNKKKLSFEDGKMTIGVREYTWRVESFGDYEDANRNARRFVSYRLGKGNVTRVYSWLWDARERRWLECSTNQFGSL